MKMKKIMSLFFCNMCLFFAYAQEDKVLSTPQREALLMRFEELIEEDGANQESLEELLLEEQEIWQFTGKVNLNALSAQIAFEYLHLTDYQYYNILSYISEYGEMVSVWELMAVDGFSNEDVKRLEPLVTVGHLHQRGNFFKNFFGKSKSKPRKSKTSKSALHRNEEGRL